MEFEKRENITLIVVLIISAIVFGGWGINKLLNPPEKTETEYRFDFDFAPYGYPDIIIELEFEREHSVEEKEKLIGDFASLYNGYNEKAENPIHYLDAYDCERADKKLSFYIDFGNADEDALYMFLDYLNSGTSEIARVRVY